MKEERKYKEPGYTIGPKTGKVLLYVLFVLRVILVIGCIWGLFMLFG